MSAKPARNVVPFVGVERMMALMHAIGIETMLCDLADAIKADFNRWPKPTRLMAYGR